MNRRLFLAALAGAFVAPGPEKLLWVPGRKLISIPKPRVTIIELAAFDVMKEKLVTRQMDAEDLVLRGILPLWVLLEGRECQRRGEPPLRVHLPY